MAKGILKIAIDDEEQELQFELEFLAGLSVEQRVRLVLERSRLLLDTLRQNGHPITPGVVKRS
jgi:hypothetical protein